jgi:hypothetical protein
MREEDEQGLNGPPECCHDLRFRHDFISQCVMRLTASMPAARALRQSLNAKTPMAR